MEKVARGARRLAVLVVVALAAATVVGTRGATAAEATADESAIRTLLAEQTAAWNRGDAKAWTAGFAGDADFVNILGMYFAGRQAIEDRHAQLFATIFRGSQLAVSVEKVRFVGSDAAVAETVHQLRGFARLPPGIQPTDASGELRTRLKYVLERRPEGWTIVSAQNTAIHPTPP